jgi:hypothetical protein
MTTDIFFSLARLHRARYDPYSQVRGRVQQLRNIGHTVDKVEFIVMGGTFLSLDKEYKYVHESCEYVLLFVVVVWINPVLFSFSLLASAALSLFFSFLLFFPSRKVRLFVCFCSCWRNKKHRDYFIRNLHDALSGYHSQSIEESIAYSENAVTKCIGTYEYTRCLGTDLYVVRFL